MAFELGAKSPGEYRTGVNPLVRQFGLSRVHLGSYPGENPRRRVSKIPNFQSSSTPPQRVSFIRRGYNKSGYNTKWSLCEQQYSLFCTGNSSPRGGVICCVTTPTIWVFIRRVRPTPEHLPTATIPDKYSGAEPPAKISFYVPHTSSMIHSKPTLPHACSPATTPVTSTTSTLSPILSMPPSSPLSH